MNSALVIPPEIKNGINPYSGLLSPDSKYSQKNLKGLFYTTENKRYLASELYQLITCEKYVEDNLPDASIEDIPTHLGSRDSSYPGNSVLTGFNNNSKYWPKQKRLVQSFAKQKNLINSLMDNVIESTQLPFQEDLGILNPVQQLSNVNLDFLVKTSRNIIQNPQNLCPDFFTRDPDTGKDESRVQYDYTAESYSDGTWHPEHLFTNSVRNKKNPYWVPVEVNIYSDPDAKGVGHRYNDSVYNGGTEEYYESGYQYDGTPKGAVPKSGSKTRSYGPFPGWQTTVNKRFYEKDTTGGLRDGGTDDRRTQRPHGYNMTSLYKKPSV